MKNFIYVLALTFVVVSCKENKNSGSFAKPLSVAEKVAFAHGFENWKNISEIDFTFNVDRDSSHTERSWRWKPKLGDITLISGMDTISYNQKSIDSTSLQADKAFINDKFWFLSPFQLIWDKGTTISDIVKEKAPISKTVMNKITLTYPNNGGGYTPGDAYDFYFGDDYLVKEWVYRRGNNDTPTIVTTWKNYKNFNGIKISLNRYKSEKSWKLYFTNVKVEFN